MTEPIDEHTYKQTAEPIVDLADELVDDSNFELDDDSEFGLDDDSDFELNDTFSDQLDNTIKAQRLREAFDLMGPDSDARARMLSRILEAQDAASEFPAIEASMPTLEQVPPRRDSRRFSLVKYVLPIAACLLVAALMPVTLPQLMHTFDNQISDSSTNSAPHASTPDTTSPSSPGDVTSGAPASSQTNSVEGTITSSSSTSSDNATEGRDDQSSIDETIEPSYPTVSAQPSDADPDHPAAVSIVRPPTGSAQQADASVSPGIVYTNAPPQDTALSLTEIICLGISLVLCLVALIIALFAVRAWRHARRARDQ